MAFELARDLHRIEVQYGVASQASIYPLAQGQRAQVAAAATWQVYSPGGDLRGSGSVAGTDVTLGARTVTRWDVPIPAISERDEDYQLRLQWTLTGLTYNELVLFDVVTAPLGEGVSASDLIQLRPDAEQTLDRMGVLQGATAGQTAQEQAAETVAIEARAQLIGWLDAATEPPHKVRPYMILDRRAVHRVERYLAMAALYQSLAKDHMEGEDQASALYRFFTNKARAEFDSLRIKYADNDDLLETGEVNGPGTSFRMQRVQS